MDNHPNTHATLHDESQRFLTSRPLDDSSTAILQVTWTPQFTQTPPHPLSSMLSSPSTTRFTLEDSRSSASSPSSVGNSGLFPTDLFVQLDFEASPLPHFPDASQDLVMIFEYKHPDAIHPSIGFPSSPWPFMSTTTNMESDEGIIPESSVRTYRPPMKEDITALAAPSFYKTEPVPTPLQLLPKKPTRRSKREKGIKCYHCGAHKTPLWRKLPLEQSGYYWYTPTLPHQD